ncbi:MAG: flavodoxin [Rhodospirillaceae bacterium]|nr:flavodoxin [Rhodospirillaceae bacterium]|tara:strand:+ start:311 stop:796 length:486 start_codon:yes stop_codon:yes gene_type:complete
MAKVLVVYYSLGGTTKRVASALAKLTGADIEVVQEVRPRYRTPWGYFRCILDSLRKRHAPIEPLHHDPAAYDVVVVGTPVWADHISSPIRTLLADRMAGAKRIAAFCTLMGPKAEIAFAEITTLCGQPPNPLTSFREKDVESGSASEAIHALAREVSEDAA